MVHKLHAKAVLQEMLQDMLQKMLHELHVKAMLQAMLHKLLQWRTVRRRRQRCMSGLQWYA